MMSLFTLTACMDSEKFHDDEIESMLETDDERFELKELPEAWYRFGVDAKRWSPVIICISLIIGLILWSTFRKNRELVSWALYTFIWVIPIGTLVLINFYTFLYTYLNT